MACFRICSLDQCDAQRMFGDPTEINSDTAVFYTVWTYAIKVLDRRYKVQCTCDGLPRSGQARILDETYANCVDQMGTRIFYFILVAENLLIFGADDVSNSFAKPPPPKQGFYIIPNKAFLEWWVNHKKCPPIPDGHVITILSAMQGHPESLCLWENHADAILRELVFTPTMHNPAYTPESSIATELFSFDRSMILLLTLWTPRQLTFYLTC
jgi:hypothetical protein